VWTANQVSLCFDIFSQGRDFCTFLFVWVCTQFYVAVFSALYRLPTNVIDPRCQLTIVKERSWYFGNRFDRLSGRKQKKCVFLDKVSLFSFLTLVTVFTVSWVMWDNNMMCCKNIRMSVSFRMLTLHFLSSVTGGMRGLISAYHALWATQLFPITVLLNLLWFRSSLMSVAALPFTLQWIYG